MEFTGGFILIIVGVAILMVSGLAAGLFLAYRRILRRAKGIERGLKMVPLRIHLPPASADTQAQGRETREVMREKISQAEAFYNLLSSTVQANFKGRFYGERHFALEIIGHAGVIYFYAAVPLVLVPTVEKAVISAYPGARLEEIEDHNIFNRQAKIIGTAGGELTLKHDYAYPIAQAEQLERDPLEALLNTLSNLKSDEGAAVQILLRPAKANWTKHTLDLVKKKQHGKGISFSPLDIAKATVKAPEAPPAAAQTLPQNQPLSLEQQVLEAAQAKTRHQGYEVLIRTLVSSSSYSRSQALLQQVVATFALYDQPGLNGFKFIPARDPSGLVTAFIFRFFPPELNKDILASPELATLFHLPDDQFTSSAALERQAYRQVDGPATLPTTGQLLGYNFFRGVKKEIRLGPEDRRRHMYIIGQTGTGKTTLLENLAIQDMMAGNGLAFIDPHGDGAERLLGLVPKNRAEDVIYFDPADTEHPLGLNLFEFQTVEQKDFLIQEAINLLYKLYDPGRTGIIGPRYEHWFRNAALTLMSDPAGATFIEIPKVFTDKDFLKQKFQYLKDPTVIDFWTKEMAATSDYHKSEMLGWFVSKFGAFMTNETMRNIIGQKQSAFNLREVMDGKKILIVNLSKGRLGELNARLLGMIMVIKMQVAAMSRADSDRRPDFGLYVDEFQNFSTDSFAQILSEARKYGLSLTVANQFIGQLTQEIKGAVFGNVGTMISFRCGPEDAEDLITQFAPAFEQRDLINLPNYHAVIRLMLGGVPSQPFSLVALPPLGQANPELALAVKQLSAAKYGRSRVQVEAEARVPTGAPADSLSSEGPHEELKLNDIVGRAATVGPAGPQAQPAAMPPLPPVAPKLQRAAKAKPAKATPKAASKPARKVYSEPSRKVDPVANALKRAKEAGVEERVAKVIDRQAQPTIKRLTATPVNLAARLTGQSSGGFEPQHPPIAQLQELTQQAMAGVKPEAPAESTLNIPPGIKQSDPEVAAVLKPVPQPQPQTSPPPKPSPVVPPATPKPAPPPAVPRPAAPPSPVAPPAPAPKPPIPEPVTPVPAPAPPKAPAVTPAPAPAAPPPPVPPAPAPAPAPTAPAPTAPSPAPTAPTEPAKPKLAPGEIWVGPDGRVYQG